MRPGIALNKADPWIAPAATIRISGILPTRYLTRAHLHKQKETRQPASCVRLLPKRVCFASAATMRSAGCTTPSMTCVSPGKTVRMYSDNQCRSQDLVDNAMYRTMRQTRHVSGPGPWAREKTNWSKCAEAAIATLESLPQNNRLRQHIQTRSASGPAKHVNASANRLVNHCPYSTSMVNRGRPEKLPVLRATTHTDGHPR